MIAQLLKRFKRAPTSLAPTTTSTSTLSSGSTVGPTPSFSPKSTQPELFPVQQNAGFTPLVQSPNMSNVWSPGMNPKQDAMAGPRFEQRNLQEQPSPLSAMELIAKHPIQRVDARVVSCDGGGGALGHPKIFINLDRESVIACGYCGVRFEMDTTHHH